MRIFVIGGKAGSGKNTVAEYIKEYYDSKNEKSIITEYSKYIKLFAKEMLNWDYKEPKPRKFLQDMGELARKTITADVFVRRMQEDILIYQKYYQNIIISDARLIPELTLMKVKYPKCYLIHVIGSEKENLTEEEKNHITELELDNYKDFDYEIINNDLDKLKEEVNTILEGLE